LILDYGSDKEVIEIIFSACETVLYYTTMLLIQLTGLSGAGKSTIARITKQLLEDASLPVIVIDGDEYRKTLCRDLGFSKEDRNENIRRLGMLAEKYVHQGIIAIIAAINPYEEIRKELTKHYQAHTIWVHCDREELIARDTKGLYKRALLPDGDPGKINNLTGINDTYDEPVAAALIINTHTETSNESALRLFAFITERVKQ
jgi:adenylylsulfate kinase